MSEFINAPKSGANNQIVSFSFESHNIRVVERDGGEAWFVASDVAKALGYERPNDAIHQHCRKATKISYGVLGDFDLQGVTAPAEDELNIISESEEFQDWVCEDVLPAIHRTGRYVLKREALAISDQRHPSLAELGCTDVKYRILEFVNECIVEDRGHRLEPDDVYWAYQWWCIRKNYRYESKKDFLSHCVWLVSHASVNHGKNYVFIDVGFSKSKLLKAPYNRNEFKAYWRQENENEDT
jgi:prophage antirepressor-like protein